VVQEGGLHVMRKIIFYRSEKTAFLQTLKKRP
jgi:hypothetical protein